MKKILITYNYGKEKLKLIEELGYEVMYVSETNIVYNDDMQDVEILICYNPFSTLDISKMKSLKWILLSSIGVDQLPIEIVKEKNIIVTNNKGGYSIPMGEWVVLKILELIKSSKSLYKNAENKIWHMDTGILELYNKTVGFIGTGSIAIEAAKRLQGFGVEILGLNTKGKPVEFFDKCYKREDIKEMVSKCDFLAIAIPSTDSTYHLINEDILNASKKGMFIINVARGNIIDEKAMIEKLKDGTIRGAALDVFEQEPLNAENPLWNMENVIVTCHNSWISEMRNERRFETIHKNLKNHIKGKELINVVDLNKGY